MVLLRDPRDLSIMTFSHRVAPLSWRPPTGSGKIRSSILSGELTRALPLTAARRLAHLCRSRPRGSIRQAPIEHEGLRRKSIENLLLVPS
jgi:hypothetical protein